MPAEEVIVICLPTSLGNPGGFDDNLYGPCATCAVEIQWRPHSPAGRHLCVPCARAEFYGETGPVIARVTPETVEDVRRWSRTR